jgi:surface protein
MSKQNSLNNLIGLNQKKAPPGGEDQQEEEQQQQQQQNTARASESTLEAKQRWNSRGNKKRNRSGARGEGERILETKRRWNRREKKTSDEEDGKPGAFPVEGPGQNDGIYVEEGNEQGHNADEVPLAAGLEDSTPHIPAAVLVDEDKELKRDEALRLLEELQEENEALKKLRDITLVEAVPVGVEDTPQNEEEEIATEATGSSSRNKYFMIAGCVSMILVVTVVVATVLLTIGTPADTPTEWPTALPTYTPTERPTALPTYTPTERPTGAPTLPPPTAEPTLSPPTKCFETTNELRQAVDNFMLDDDAVTTQLEETYGLPMGTWCVSDIQDFSELFSIERNARAAIFNEDISAWDVSKVSLISRMFFYADSFNQDISSWDVSKVSNMYAMFYRAATFDQDLSSWNMSRVEDMQSMFDGASSFNKDLSAWDVSKVSSIMYMFHEAASFNQDLCSWREKLPTYADFRFMFYSTSCPIQADPVLSANLPGSLCYPCV